MDPLNGVDLRSLFAALAGRKLLIHGADYDLRLLLKHHRFIPQSIFDTMLAGRLDEGEVRHRTVSNSSTIYKKPIKRHVMTTLLVCCCTGFPTGGGEKYGGFGRCHAPPTENSAKRPARKPPLRRASEGSLRQPCPRPAPPGFSSLNSGGAVACGHAHWFPQQRKLGRA